MSKLQIERDCTEKCKSVQHGDLISSVITKRQVTDEELCAYIRWLCSSCGQVCDSMGRTALHFAASCGRTKFVKWLISNRGALINARDLESGYTALHRSIFYGKINVAVNLIKLGANVSLMDHNGLTALEHAMKDRMSAEYSKYELHYNNQIYVWGTNTNYTLGTQHSRPVPELNTAFHKNNEYSVRQVCLEKFHCVIVAQVGEGGYDSTFSCGHGQGGRLGLNTEKTVLVPQEIQFPKHRGEYYTCSKVSIARDHSLFLSNDGVIMSCGLNTHHVLGIKSAPKQVLVPTYVPLSNKSAKGICASRFHSVAWGPDFVYTWGLHAGQLGHPQSNNTTIVAPKLVINFLSSKDIIVAVAASDGATVVATHKGDVFALHEYQCRKIGSRQLNIDKIVVIGGHLTPKLSSEILTERGGNELKVLVLLKTGNLLIWQETCPQLSRCIFNLNRPLVAVDAVLSLTELFFVTNDGEAFKGEFRTRKKKLQEPVHEKKSAFHEFLDKDDCQIVNVTKFPHIHRAMKIECDLKGRNFAAIQNTPQDYSIEGAKWPRSTIQKDMLNLFNNTDGNDNIHDGVFIVSGQKFLVHKYIIAMQSEPLFSLLENSSGNPVEITNINPYLFKQILIFIYTNTCDFLTSRNLPPEVMNFCEINRNTEENKSAYNYFNKDRKNNAREKNPSNLKKSIGIIQHFAKRFGVKSLGKKLEKLSYYDRNICKKNIDCYEDAYFDWQYDHLQFDRNKFKNLSDVVLKSQDGCEIHAHKCILTRLEYFRNLFAVRWNKKTEKSVVSLPISYKVLNEVITFLYTDNIFKNPHDFDHLCNVLVICDQLLIEELKTNCENFLSDLLTLKNVAQVLQFSFIYNAGELKYNCMSFITKNLAAVLESKSLEILDDEMLDALTKHYGYAEILSKRMITPFSDAPSDEEVRSIFELHPVNIEDSDQENFERKTPKLVRRKVRTRKSSETNRNRTISESMDSSSEHNLSFSETFEDKPDEKWVKILTEKEKHQKIVQCRLKAIASAKEELDSEKLDEKLTKLVSQPKIIPKTESPIKSPVSPLQNSNNSNFSFETIKSPTMNDIPIQKAQKMSQKQRKKLAISSMAEDLDRINNKTSWNSVVLSKENNSFSDIMKNDNEFPEINVGSPKNPWQKVEVPSPIVSPETKQNFKDIVADEKKLKENWAKMKDRPLIYIQMEDKAMKDLERFYNIDEVTEEYISIHKVEKGAVAVPLWVQNNTKH